MICMFSSAQTSMHCRQNEWSAVSMNGQFYSAGLIYFYLAFQKQEHLSPATDCNRFG